VSLTGHAAKQSPLSALFATVPYVQNDLIGVFYLEINDVSRAPEAHETLARDAAFDGRVRKRPPRNLGF
jgi:hypothetical protein